MAAIPLCAPSTSPGWNRDSALKATEAIIRLHSRTFYLATGLLPGAQRKAIRALYAFCRATDDLVDRQDARPADIEAWRERVARPPEAQDNPLLYAWAYTRQQYQVEHRYEQELINGVLMDLYQKTYRSWSDLERYCYHVASTVGLLSIPIIGLAPGASFEHAAAYAIRLGLALQLTNILRDVGEDLERGRVYLPLEDLRRFDLTLEDLFNRVYDARFVALMRFEIERARQLYREALPGIALLNPSARPAVGAAALLYRAILDEIEAIHYRVYEQRAYTTALRKLSMLPGILYTIARLSPPA